MLCFRKCDKIDFILKSSLFLTALLYCYAFVFIEFGDTKEHINTSWLITQGLVPYRDFFQNHHPLLWYLMAPVVAVFDYYKSAGIVILCRIILLGITFGSCFWLYKIVKEFINIPHMALLTTLIFVSNDFLLIGETVFRPDNFMLLFGLMGLYYFMKYHESKKVSTLYLSSVLFFISFMFLQKILLFFIALGICTLKDLQDKKMEIKPLLKASGIFSGLYLIFLLLFWKSGALSSYFYNNLTLNFLINGGRVLKDLSMFEMCFAAFYLFCFLFFINKKIPDNLRFLVNLALLYLGLTVMTCISYPYYLMFPFALMTPLIAYGIIFYFKNVAPFHPKEKYLVIAFLIFFLSFIVQRVLAGNLYLNTAVVEYKRLQFVLDNVPANELIFNGEINRIGLFHKNVHPLHHQLSLNAKKKSLGSWGASFDEIRELIKEKKPYLFMDHWPLDEDSMEVDFDFSGGFALELDEEILDLYEKEPIWGFYIRKK